MGILIPKYRHIDEGIIHPINVHHRIGGEIRAMTRDEMGNIKQDTGWIPNLVTNRGIKTLVTPYNVGDGWQTGHIGSSTQAPAGSDTTLIGWLAADNTSRSLSNERNDGSPNWTFGSTYRFRWTQASAYTVNEFGLSYYSSNQDMNVRALVTPTINKATDQTLDIYHRFTVWPDITTQTGTVTIYGEVYDYELRPAEMDQSNYAHSEPGGNEAYWYEGGTFGAINGRPTGTNRYIGGATNAELSQTNNLTGTESRDDRTTWGLDYGDGFVLDYLFNRMGWTSRTSQSGGGYQVSFAKQVGGTGIVKANTQIMWLDWRLTFSRYP